MAASRPPGTPLSPVELAPFSPRRRESLSLPPPPGALPVRAIMPHAALVGQILAAVGAALVLGSVFAAGWDHLSGITITNDSGQMNDSYTGDVLTVRTNHYSLAVWAYLRYGFAIPVLVAAVGTAAISLVGVGMRRRIFPALTLLGVLAMSGCIALDLYRLPKTLLGIASNAPVEATALHLHGVRPGPMMLIALAGLFLQVNGALLTLRALRRARLLSATERQTERQQQPVGQFQPGSPGEYAIQHAAPLPQHPPHQRQSEWQGEPRQQHPT